MKAIAHRGCMDDYPENTVAAFREAAPHADAVECDVQRCGSGELVVFHDKTMDRVTGRSGRIDATDWSELRTMDVHASGESIPQLHEVFDAVPSDTDVTVELKDTGIASSVVNYTEQVPNDVIVSSFDWDELRAARDAGASTLAALCYDDVEGALSVASELGCEYIHPPKELCLETDVVERAHDRGVQINVWTGESRTDVDELRAVGADGISTNRIDLLEYIRSSA